MKNDVGKRLAHFMFPVETGEVIHGSFDGGIPPRALKYQTILS